MKIIPILSLLALTCFGLTPLKAATYTVDPEHSAILFKVQHNGISFVHGRFNQFKGKVVFDPQDPSKNEVDFTVQTDSIDTNNIKRDNHLRGPDFFNAKQFPTATFKSTSVKPISDTDYEIKGDFTVAGITKPVSFTGTLGGHVADQGSKRAGSHGTFTIKRSDHGITYGLPKVGDDVEITFYIQAQQG